jgi:hypothetical protein
MITPCLHPSNDSFWKDLFQEAVHILSTDASSEYACPTHEAAPEITDTRLLTTVHIAVHPSISTARQLAQSLATPSNNLCLVNYFDAAEWSLFTNKKYVAEFITIESHPVKQALAMEVCKNLQIFPENLVILHFFTLNRFYAVVKTEHDVFFKRFH